MKKMVFVLLALFAVLLCSCGPNLDDNQGDQNQKPPQEENNLVSNSTLVSNLNNSVASLQTIVVRLSKNDYIKSIDTVYNAAGIIEKIILKFAEDTLNTNGIEIFLQSGSTSTNQNILVSAKKDVDSIYYWMVDNAWLKDENGDKIEVSGNSVLKTKIEDGYWYYTHDNGKSWVKAGQVTNQSFNYVFSNMRTEGEQLVLSLADGTDLNLPLKKEFRLYFTTKPEELEGWAEGLFIEDGTWALVKPVGKEGYLFTLGEADSKEGIIVYCDTLMRVREMYAGGAIICMRNYTQDSVQVDVVDKVNGNISVRIPFKQENTSLQSDIIPDAKSGEASDVSLGFSLMSNFVSMGDAIIEICNNTNIKNNTLSFAKNKFEFTINLVSALTGKDVYENHKVLGNSLQILSLGVDIKTFQQFKLLSLSAGSSILGVIGIYAGLYATYIDLYNEHIEALYASCAANIKGIDINDLSAKISVEITGHENWQNYLQCGVAVSKFLLPSFEENGEVKSVTHNGVYVFNVSNLENGVKYHCRPFVIDKNRTSLWIGFIGELAGPLVRYGEESTFEIPKPEGSVIECVEIKDKSAVAKCSFSNTNSGTACGVKLEWNGGSVEVSANNKDGEQNVVLSGLKPATEYTCTAYVRYGNTTVYGRESKTFKTNPPSIAGTWSCKETHYNVQGLPYYETYNITLKDDGGVVYSETGGVITGSWSFTESGHVEINITDLATSYNVSGKCWSGSVDNMTSPVKITGYTYRWNANNIGSFKGEPFEFEMTK